MISLPVRYADKFNNDLPKSDIPTENPVFPTAIPIGDNVPRVDHPKNDSILVSLREPTTMDNDMCSLISTAQARADTSVLTANDVKVPSDFDHETSDFDHETSDLDVNHASTRHLDDLPSTTCRVTREADLSQGPLYFTGLLFPKPPAPNIKLDVHFDWYHPRLGWMPLDVMKQLVPSLLLRSYFLIR